MAADAGLEWTRFEDVGRTGAELSGQLREVAFRMPRPTFGTAQFDGVLDDHGDFVIVALSRVEDGDTSSMSDEEIAVLRRALESDNGRTAFDAFVRGRRQSADVRIVEQNPEG